MSGGRDTNSPVNCTPATDVLRDGAAKWKDDRHRKWYVSSHSLLADSLR